MPNEHWVVVAARRAGLEGAETLQLDRAMPADHAWRDAAAALGIGEEELTPVIARHFRLAPADLGSATEGVLKLVPAQLVHRHRVMPLRQTDRELIVATSDPGNLEVEQALGFVSGRQPIFELAPPGPLQLAIDAHYPEDRPVAQMLRRLEPRQPEEVAVVDRLASEIKAARGGESGAVIRLANLILRSAIQEGASRMDLTPVEGGGRITLWVNGVDRHFMQLPASALKRIVGRLNVFAHLGPPHPRLRQTGATRLQVDGRTYDTAITTEPREGGGHRATVKFSGLETPKALDDLGLPAETLLRLRRLLDERAGLVVVTGPPASGKTTLLYAAAAAAAAGGGTATLEAAIERTIPGLAQHRPEPLRGIDPRQALEGALAGATTTLFVDAPVDAPMLNLVHRGIRAGRLVVLTVEAPDAETALGSLIERGMSGGQLAEILKGVTSQSLLRQLCDACATEASPPMPDEVRLAQAHGVDARRRAVGCPDCAATGYRGLLPVAQVVEATDDLRRELQAAGRVVLAEVLADAGLRSPLAAATDAVADGRTSIDELDRVLGRGADGAGSGPRVLVADDDPETVLLARTVLEKGGYAVSESPDGEAALSRIALEPFSLVILDLNMPRLDGREVLRQLKGRVATAGLPVIVLTSSESSDDEVLMMEEGAEDYIRKPIDPPRFIARVRAALRRTGSPE